LALSFGCGGRRLRGARAQGINIQRPSTAFDPVAAVWRLGKAAVKKAAADSLKLTDKACIAHDHDAGMDRMRKDLQQIGLKPAV
jgi:hypothetical protein